LDPESPGGELNIISTDWADLISDSFLTTENLILLGVIILLIIGSALVSGSEIAYFSYGPEELKGLEESTSKKKHQVKDLLGRPRYLLSTILIANNLFNIAVILTSFYLLENVFAFDRFEPWVEILINAVLVTFLIVLFGEVLPKVYATQKGERLALLMSTPLLFMRSLFKPISTLLIRATRIV